eukprot:COSAG01_NODE_1577_length_9847_cov_11.543394_5_plen_185_part_00
MSDPARLAALLLRARGDVTWASHLYYEQLEEGADGEEEGEEEGGDEPGGGGAAVAAAAAALGAAAGGGAAGVAGLQLAIVPVPPASITPEQVAELGEVTRDNLNESQMRCAAPSTPPCCHISRARMDGGGQPRTTTTPESRCLGLEICGCRSRMHAGSCWAGREARWPWPSTCTSSRCRPRVKI